MSTDDPDIESSNPSKNFKVGDFDQSSGFFTPVWESKRRIRSEPPAPPPSSKGNSQRSAPSSRRNVDRVASGAEPTSASASADALPASDRAGGRAKASPVPRPRSDGPKARSTPPPPRAATPVPPAPSSERASAVPAEPVSAVPALPPAVAEVFSAPIEEDAEAARIAASAASASASEVEPEAQREPRAPTPSAAARALREAGPDLPPAAFLDQEPDFRSPRPAVPRPGRTDRSPGQYRSLRATSAATRVHEQLKAKLQAEAAEIDESRYDLEPETHPNPLQGLDPAEPDPYPLSLMRRLRRTIRLATPVPDRIRSIISRFDRG